MKSLRRAIERYYLSIFILSMCAMAVVFLVTVERLTMNQIDQDLYAFANDLIQFLENPSGELIAIFGKKDYSFQVIENGKTYASYNVTDKLPAGHEGFAIDDYKRIYATTSGTYRVIVAKNIKDHFILIVTLSLVLGSIILILSILIHRFGLKLTSRMIQPIEEIGKQMDDVSRGLAKQIQIEPTSQEAHILQEQINDALTRLHNTMEELREFASSLSHQLRNPLASARAQIEVMLKEAKSEETKMELLSVMKNINRMVQITSGLLLIARAQHQREDSFQEEDLSVIVLESVEQVMQRFPQIDFVLDVPAEIKARCVSGLLSHAFLNLVENACKYTEEGKSVEISLKQQDAAVIFSVSNHGEPVAKEEREKIFERFYRAKNAKNEGLGLGLAVVKAIVDLHHGKVQYSYNGVNRFTIHLPK
ncbi:sensor histidine kinase [Pseudothermotoga sp. U03pept]|uniref:sensor histidine kinase n=1 Tax=Pseudothermotoga sp. U03pept TaxID=3447012 RepID=UPI003F101D6B